MKMFVLSVCSLVAVGTYVSCSVAGIDEDDIERGRVNDFQKDTVPNRVAEVSEYLDVICGDTFCGGDWDFQTPDEGGFTCDKSQCVYAANMVSYSLLKTTPEALGNGTGGSLEGSFDAGHWLIKTDEAEIVDDGRLSIPMRCSLENVNVSDFTSLGTDKGDGEADDSSFKEKRKLAYRSVAACSREVQRALVDYIEYAPREDDE